MANEKKKREKISKILSREAQMAITERMENETEQKDETALADTEQNQEEVLETLTPKKGFFINSEDIAAVMEMETSRGLPFYIDDAPVDATLMNVSKTYTGKIKFGCEMNALSGKNESQPGWDC